MIDTLVENIAAWKDVGVVQDQSVNAQFGIRQGVIVAEFAVKALMNIAGVTALPVATYYINVADSRNAVGSTALGTASATRRLSLPDNSILTRVPIVDIHEAKVGSGTITPAIGAVTLAAVTSVGTSVDDGAGDVLVVGRKGAAEEAISMAVATNTVTAGAFTIFIEYLQGL